MKQECVKRLASEYGKQLIVDNAQAFYAEPLKGIDTFYSVRKFFGVPDGAYLYTDNPLVFDFEQDHSYERMSHLLKRIDLGAEDGYQDFRNNDDSLRYQEIKKMSKLTEAILAGIDYEAARRKRRDNYLLLDEMLGTTNRIHLDMTEESVPMVYPYMTDNSSLKQKLIEDKIFVATYWPNVFEWTTDGMMERMMAERLVPVLCDQRYEESDMDRCLNKIVELN